MAALSLALEINNVYEELKKATDVLKATSLEPGVVANGEVPTTEDQATLERRYNHIPLNAEGDSGRFHTFMLCFSDVLLGARFRITSMNLPNIFIDLKDMSDARESVHC